jgi:hypothetical protein
MRIHQETLTDDVSGGMPPSIPAAHVLAPVAAGVRPGLGQGYAGVRMGWLVRLG